MAVPIAESRFMPSLFDPVDLSPALHLPNRLLMAPLTRGRATRDGVPTQLQADYYAQRAGAGLIISEATGISREGLGWPFAPGLWSDEQVEGWRVVTGAVHAAGGRIVAQLWHMGRLVHGSVSGMRNISASATTAPNYAHTYDGKQPYPEAREATLDDIERIVGDYATAARNAILGGFDGVQIHGANGYLIDQFLRDGTNLRTDDYGGPVDNRLRFMTDVVEAVIGEVGRDRTAIRLSPVGESQGCDDSDNIRLFTAAAARLETLDVPWIELREPGPQSTFRATDEPPASPSMRQVYSGKIILNSDYDGISAQAKLDEGVADAISFGRPYIANPDLPERIRENAALNEWNVKTFYSQGPEGYVDYPSLKEQADA
jgi:2,4-dienoyl-CoA reductase-like NADH-dependent reductase (Old Yellow Enzyme family)